MEGGDIIKHLNRLENPDTQNPEYDFNTYYERYFRQVFKHAAYLTGDVQAAEDIAQETFIKLYNLPPEHSNVGAWLVKVSSNLAYNYLRDQKLHRNKEPELEVHEESNIISIEDIAIKNSEIRLTRKVLNRLDERDKMCLMLKFSGYKYSEISEITGVEKNSVGQVLARAQAKFTKIYKEYCID